MANGSGPRTGALYLTVLLSAAAGFSSCAHSGGPPPPSSTPATAGGALPRYCNESECEEVVAHNSEIEDCECDERRLDESFGARLDLVFAVPPAGGNAMVSIGRAISVPEPLRRCVLDRAATWSFAAPAGGSGTLFRAGVIFAPDDRGACARPANSPSHQARVDKERARVALLGQRGDVQACFQKVLGSPPPPGSRAVVTVLVNREGRVIQAEVDDSTLPDPKIDPCVVEKAFGWQLPKPSPPGVVTLSYPYAFGPGS